MKLQMKLQIEKLEDRRLLAFDPFAESFVSDFETIANYAPSPTILSAKDGAWSDPATWGGAVPGTSDKVHINHDVSYGRESYEAVVAININPGASLSFDGDRDTRLELGTILVHSGATLEVGTPGDPIQDAYAAEIVFADLPFRGNDTAQHGIGLIVLDGTFTTNGRNVDQRFVRIAKTINAGDIQVKMVEEPDWQPGDQLFLPDRFIDGSKVEYPVVDSVDGVWVNVESPMQHYNPGAAGNRMHLANLTSNIRFTSEDPNGNRGHILLLERSEVDVRDAVFEELGRTTVEELNPTNNHTGRYSFHLHHMYGSEQPLAGQSWTFKDNVILGGEKWGLAIHDSHWGTASNNVIVDVEGAGIAIESGSETGNVIENNFTALHVGSGDGTFSRDPDIDNGHEGVGIWMRGSNNVIRDNVVANGAHSGIFVWSRSSTTDQQVPAFVGADPRVDFMRSHVQSQSPLEFSDNEVYASDVGLKTDGVAGKGGEWYASGQKVWRSQRGVETLYVGRIRLDDLDLDGIGGQSTGIWVGYGNRLTLNNPDIRSYKLGLSTGNSVNITGGFFDNNVKDLQLNYEKPGHDHRVSHITDVGFGNKSQWRIAQEWSPTFYGQSFTVPDDVVVTNFNGVEGDNFLVYMDEQAPDYVMQASGQGLEATGNQKFSPDAGLTNQQLWDTYRLSAGGRVLPAEAVTKAKVTGKIGEVPADLSTPMVKDIVIEHLSDTSLRFTWNTNEPSTTGLEWWPTDRHPVGSHGYLEDVDVVLKTSHEVVLDGLAENQIMSYTPRSTNADGITSRLLGRVGNEYRTYKASTNEGAEAKIYFPQVTNVKDSSAQFKFVTTDYATGRVDVFRKDTREFVSHGTSEEGQDHKITIDGLESDTQYYGTFTSWNGKSHWAGSKDFTTKQADPALCIRKWW